MRAIRGSAKRAAPWFFLRLTLAESTRSLRQSTVKHRRPPGRILSDAFPAIHRSGRGGLMANVLGVVWFVVAFVIAQTSMMVWTALVLPNPVARARRRIEAAPRSTFFLGAAFWILTLVFAGS